MPEASASSRPKRARLGLAKQPRDRSINEHRNKGASEQVQAAHEQQERGTGEAGKDHKDDRAKSEMDLQAEQQEKAQEKADVERMLELARQAEDLRKHAVALLSRRKM